MINKTYITNDCIRKIGYHRYVTGDTNYSKRFNWMLYDRIRELLLAAKIKANSCETLMLIHIPSFQRVITSNCSNNTVRLSPIMNNALRYNNGPFIAIHNHPNNSEFSLADILVLTSFESLTMCFAVANNGVSIHFITKPESIAHYKVYKLLIKILNYLVNNKILDRHSTAKPYINLLKRFGFKYKSY